MQFFDRLLNGSHLQQVLTRDHLLVFNALAKKNLVARVEIKLDALYKDKLTCS